MQDSKVLANITDEENQGFIQLNAMKTGALQMLEKVNEQLTLFELRKREHFDSLAEKYGFDPQVLAHIDVFKKQIIEGHI